MQEASTQYITPPGPAGANPDAELIAACAQHIVNHAIYNTDGGYLEPDEDPLWEAYCHTHDAIGRAQPQTIEGALAKARAAKVEALSRDGTEVPENGPAARWAWQLMNDMLRLSVRSKGNPDAELLALSAEFHAAQNEMDAMDPDALYDGDPQIDRECDLVDRVLYILAEMAEFWRRWPN